MTRLRFVGLGLVLFFLALAILAPFIAPYDPSKIGIAYQPPSSPASIGHQRRRPGYFQRAFIRYARKHAHRHWRRGYYHAGGNLSGGVGRLLGRYGRPYHHGAYQYGHVAAVFAACICAGAYLPSGVLSILFSICITSWASSARLVRARTCSLPKCRL